MDYFKSDGKFIYPEQYTEFYIPKYYFENKFSEDTIQKRLLYGLKALWIYSVSKTYVSILVQILPGSFGNLETSEP